MSPIGRLARPLIDNETPRAARRPAGRFVVAGRAYCALGLRSIEIDQRLAVARVGCR